MTRLNTLAERAVQVCGAAVAFAFFASGVIYLYLGRWAVTFADYWSIYDWYLNRTWPLSVQPFIKYNDHLVFFPSLILLADIRFFHGDQQLLFLVGLALLLITASLLLAAVWLDRTVSLTAKILSTLVIMMGNFWMVRTDITAVGGFNCMCSLTMGGAALAFLLTPKARSFLPTMPVIVSAGFIASFSFGTGLAIWPTLLLLAWCLRLPSRSIVLLGVSTVATGVIYVLLPHSKDYVAFFQEPRSAGVAFVTHLCRLVGSPVFNAAVAWRGNVFRYSGPPYMLALWTGVTGLLLGAVAVVPRVVRRDVGKSSLQIAGLGLVIFNAFALMFVAAGRIKYFSVLAPPQIVALRYVFWSSLLWTGLLLVGIERAESLRRVRWPIFLLVLAAAGFAWPAHYQHWAECKYVQCLLERAATALINGVRDEQVTRVLADEPNGQEKIERVAGQFRARRLDMFAGGLQDWIGLDESRLWRGRHERERLMGQCRIEALVQCDNGAPAARVVGWAMERRPIPHLARWAITPLSWMVGQQIKRGYVIPKILVIVDPAGVVRGVARSAPLSPLINRTFYFSRLAGVIGFLGYIRDYDPQLKYEVRSADDQTLSNEKILVQTSAIIPPT